MPDDNALRNLGRWLLPSSSRPLDAETLEARRRAVERVASEIGPVDTLVLAAHGDVPADVAKAIDAIVLDEDSTYVADRKHELHTRLAGSAVAVLLASEEPAPVALLVQSASFIGLKPTIEELTSLADAVVLAESSRARARSGIKAPAGPIKRILDPNSEIDEAQIVAAINAVARRSEEVAAAYEAQLALMDEEIDALWWSRSTICRLTKEPWAEMKALRRTVLATVELSRIVSELPVSRGLVAVLGDVVGNVEGESGSLLKIAELLVRFEWNATSAPRRLLPLGSASKIVADYATEKDAIPAVIKTSIGLAAGRTFPLAQVAEQLCRELAIVRLGQ